MNGEPSKVPPPFTISQHERMATAASILYSLYLELEDKLLAQSWWNTHVAHRDAAARLRKIKKIT